MRRKMKPIHPGIILKEDFLKELNLSITKAALSLNVSRKRLSDVVNENADINAEMALRLEKAFDVDAQFWMDLQSKYNLWKAETSGRVRNVHRIPTQNAIQ